MIYYNLSLCVAECHDCGETRPCTRLTAPSAEFETGYIDQLDVCDECWRERDERGARRERRYDC